MVFRKLGNVDVVQVRKPGLGSPWSWREFYLAQGPEFGTSGSPLLLVLPGPRKDSHSPLCSVHCGPHPASLHTPGPTLLYCTSVQMSHMQLTDKP